MINTILPRPLYHKVIIHLFTRFRDRHITLFISNNRKRTTEWQNTCSLCCSCTYQLNPAENIKFCKAEKKPYPLSLSFRLSSLRESVQNNLVFFVFSTLEEEMKKIEQCFLRDHLIFTLLLLLLLLKRLKDDRVSRIIDNESFR